MSVTVTSSARGERGAELAREMARARVEVRLEEHAEPAARESLARGRDRRGELGRMVAVVVDDRHAVSLRDLEAAARCR